jgi:hypothetical protein
MPRSRRRISRSVFPVFLSATFCLVVASLAPNGALAQVCDPPGPPPRFSCSWSTDICDWICPICDPFGVPPRQSCSWSLELCNWICPGYSGVNVTVQTTNGPHANATVYVRLSSLCTVTGAGAMCGGSFPVFPGMPVASKCQAIANVVANDCSADGYVVTTNDCAGSATLVASNLGCPATPFTLGLSNDPDTFDQTASGAMPDGETDVITGSNAACATTPGPVPNLMVTVSNNGANLQLAWGDATNAEDYVVYSDTAANGAFATVEGTAKNGNSLTIPMPSASEYYLVAGRNAACGVGPKE